MSVRSFDGYLFVMRWYCDPTRLVGSQDFHHRIAQDSSFGDVRFRQKLEKIQFEARANELNKSRVWQIFDLSHCFSESVQRLLLPLIGSRIMRFRLVPKSTTLDGLEQPLRILLHNACFMEPVTKI